MASGAKPTGGAIFNPDTNPYSAANIAARKAFFVGFGMPAPDESAAASAASVGTQPDKVVSGDNAGGSSSQMAAKPRRRRPASGLSLLGAANTSTGSGGVTGGL